MSRIDDAARRRPGPGWTGSTRRDVPAALDRGALLVDIRPQAQRAREGDGPGGTGRSSATYWSGAATRPATRRLPQAVGDDVEWVVLCSEGYTSSLAAAALQDLGLHRATDVVGGYHALKAAGVLATSY